MQSSKAFYGNFPLYLVHRRFLSSKEDKLTSENLKYLNGMKGEKVSRHVISIMHG